jgi:type II secretory pathway component PulL
MQRNMDTLQARGGTRANDMLVLLSRAATIPQTEPRARIRGVQYSERSLMLDVTLPDGTSLERVRQALQSNGVQADVVSNNAREKEIDGRLRLRAANSTPGGKS